MKYNTAAFPKARVQKSQPTGGKSTRIATTSTSVPHAPNFTFDQDFNNFAIIKGDVNLDFQDDTGQTKLHRATINRLGEQINSLLFDRASVSIRDSAENESLRALCCSKWRH